MPEDAGPATDVADTPDAPEPAAPEQEGTPAPESQDSSAEVDWQDRYEHLHPEYTRATQEASQYRQIIDLARQGDPEALAALGLEVEGDEDDDDYDPEAEEPLTRAEFEAWQQQQDEARSQQEKEDEFRDLQEEFVDHELSRLAKDSSDRYKAILRDRAFGISDDDGLPDFETAHKELQEEFEEQRSAYLKSKKAEKVEVGTAGTEKVNLDDDDARVALMADMIEANSQD